MIYVVETPRELFWSNRKINAQWKHIEFLYKDKARYKEFTEDKWSDYASKANKKLIQLEEVQ